ncbi:hypothetical protein [Krasilnikovia sp. MM14-A1259]|uniref:hypothetical protein n=1 Tax=Krasilnikovia sp. MM14-A1259 TaxID=3373539 RepID=UPI0037F65422
MDLRVIEGRLAETRFGQGVERRAFGEFVGPCGELASFAFGWTTESEHHVARITVGIGAGNPGGASFHAIIFNNEGSYACTLVDEPFERVPEGGPDLTAVEARAHEDLPFIWWVVDRVMERDRRARWMKHWLLGTTSIQTGEVFARTEPILYVCHDADDGLWQLIGASDADSAKAKLSHLYHAVEHDPTLLDVLDLSPGGSASRTGLDEPWTSEPAFESSHEG